jgi:L-amino acid N-acyltransferase YncA
MNTAISFEEQPVPVAEMAARGSEIASASFPWLVAESDAGIVGYAYASKWKGRCAYRYSAEATVYVAPSATGRGIGTLLYRGVFDALRALQMRVVIGGIALPNEASVALHEKMGMRKVAHFEQVGYKFGRWIDVAYYQRSL